MTFHLRLLIPAFTPKRSAVGSRSQACSRLLTCAAACALLTSCGEPDEVAVAPMPVHVVVCCESHTASMTLSGTLVPRVESQLAFRVPGRMVERLVDLGQQVVQGQALAKLDTTPFQLAQQEAAADLAQAQTSLAQVQRDVERNRPLAQSGVIANAAFDALQTQQAQVQEQVQAAHSRLAQVRNELGYATLTAPASGTIARIQADAGEVVAAGTPVLRLAQLGKLGGEHEVEVHVPESRIGQIASGQAAKVHLLSLPKRELVAHVREIASVADLPTRTYRVRLALSEWPAAARLSMSASVRFDAPAHHARLQLPLTALFQHGEQPAVWVLPDGAQHLQLRPVTLTAMGSDTITLSTGIEPGERVVVAGAHRLDSAMTVQAWDGRLP